ncbi:hypothetical protein QFC21_006511 [Naganishia friedmannii]|uniref:Uncharacterized protein n=1 Tax=Naganishia friedmannii TaxID=89922 RepID=A0ACC2V2F6_9TREE|nr:hypothetical protein QFC21_006511 [Naganishia friedmannii]
MEMSDNSFSIGDFVSENTARLSVTGNRILAVLLVAVVVLVTLFWLLRRNVERYSKFLAPRLKFGQKVYFLDRSMDNLIKDYVAPTPQTVAGELSFDNLMSIWFTRTIRNIMVVRGLPRPVEVISDVRRHKEAMHALERVVVRYGRLKDTVGTLKLTVEEAIMKDFVQELTKVGEILEKHKKNELKEVKRIAKLKKKNRYIPPQGNHVYLTFSSSRQACVAFKELLEKKEMQVGTEERYVPEKHVIFAPPPAELWHRVGDRAAIARVKDVEFYLVFVLTVIIAAFLTMAIGSLYNVESLAKMLPLAFLRNFVKQHPAILGNFSSAGVSFFHVFYDLPNLVPYSSPSDYAPNFDIFNKRSSGSPSYRVSGQA